jgi:hypothetical protein
MKQIAPAIMPILLFFGNVLSTTILKPGFLISTRVQLTLSPSNIKTAEISNNVV